MNEPSVFNGIEMTMPRDALHFDGDQVIPHFQIHNIYGHFYHKVAYNSLKYRYDDRIRPFVLSRSFFAGSQQFGFIWTGDNKATWNFLKSSVDMIQTISLCGISACGADVGGFAGNPTEELLRSWFQLGVFYPFFRGHSKSDSIRREPWLFSMETLESVRESINLRYNLLWYWYTKFFEHSKTGVPIVKPLWLRFGKLYEEMVKNNNGFAVGEEFIIIPFTNKKHEIRLPLINNFYDFETGDVIDEKKINELESRKDVVKIVVPGSIIPFTEKLGKSSEDIKLNPITLLIFPDDKGHAFGTLYIDDGQSFEYQKGNFIYWNFRYENNELFITNKNPLTNCNMEFAPELEKVVVHSVKGKRIIKLKDVIVGPKGYINLGCYC